MPDSSRKKLHRATAIYWMLLLYIIAALIWWFISLNTQNATMKNLKIHELNTTIDSVSNPLLFQNELKKINIEHSRNKSKYLGEGSIFLLLILVGAVFIYRSVRRQLIMQQQQQNFMMAVTHELKTPVSVVRLNLETMQRYSLDPEKQKKIIRMTLEETERLNFLTNNILISSQLEGARYKSSKEDLDLSDLLKDCILNFRNRFPERIFKEEIEQDADVKGDALLLQMLINNLLENAIKYSPKESPVTALLKKHNSDIILQIMDEGPGIADEEKKKIFSKFYRIGNEATRKTQGTGLGLYIVKQMVEAHSGKIWVESKLKEGSTFRFTLPLSR